jgi:hypothetical protein
MCGQQTLNIVSMRPASFKMLGHAAPACRSKCLLLFRSYVFRYFKPASFPVLQVLKFANFKDSWSFLVLFQQNICTYRASYRIILQLHQVPGNI